MMHILTIHLFLSKMIDYLKGKQYLTALFKIFGIGLFSFVVVRSGWLNDDAYITFRTVDNFVNGYGLTWNTVDRVQAYTHPLWLFLLIIARQVTGEIFYASILLSVIVSVLGVYLIVFRIARFTETAILAITILTLSKAFIDYSTSGLENPLTHLLVILFLLVYFQGDTGHKRLFWLSFIGAMGLLNRIDTALFFLPSLIVAFAQIRQKRSVFIVAIGFIPLIAWEIFSIFYYGFLFPNTAYAKMLNTNIPTTDLVWQGITYLQNSVKWDPLTLSVVSVSIIITFLAWDRRVWPVTVGFFLYILYVVKIGGDFMSGRFLALPLLAATIILIVFFDTIRLSSQLDRLKEPARFGVGKWKKHLSANGYKFVFLFSFIGVCSLGLFGKHQAILYGSEYDTLAKHEENWRDGDIADERMYYYRYTGLLNHKRQVHSWQTQGQNLRNNGPRVIGQGNVGFLGFYAGPDVHIIDRYGLTDPLLARLPVAPAQEWRIGHFPRDIPVGYIETFVVGQNQIKNQNLALYYQKLTIVTRGGVFSKTRFVEIWNLNTGKYDYLLGR